MGERAADRPSGGWPRRVCGRVKPSVLVGEIRRAPRWAPSNSGKSTAKGYGTELDGIAVGAAGWSGGVGGGIAAVPAGVRAVARIRPAARRTGVPLRGRAGVARA